MTQGEARLVLLEHQIRGAIPKFKVCFKNESRWHRFIGKLVFFNPNFYKGFVQTFYPRVWWHSREKYEANKYSSFKVLAHEYVHLWDRKNNQVSFNLGYVFPQFLGVAALGAVAAFYSLWFLWFLVALGMFLPWPAYFRTKTEMRGYAMSMAVNIWKYGNIRQETKDYIAKHFTGWAYYKMWPFKKSVVEKIEDAEEAIHVGDYMNERPFAEVFQIAKLSNDDAIRLATELKK